MICEFVFIDTEQKYRC